MARVVRMPSCELFDDQDRNYRESVLSPHLKARESVGRGIRLLAGGNTRASKGTMSASKPLEPRRLLSNC